MSPPQEFPRDGIEFLTSFTTREARRIIEATDALGSIERALRRAHAVVDAAGRRLAVSGPVERELNKEGWRKARVWVPPGLPRGANDSYDGWRVFADVDGSRFGIAVEVEFSWNRVYFDFLKLWRGQRGRQIRAGIIVLPGPDSYHYAEHHQYAMYGELFAELAVCFCALDDPALADAAYVKSRPQWRIPMPSDEA